MFEMKGLMKALDEDSKKVKRRAGGVTDSERKELADFYERELAKYATTKHGGGKAFTNDKEEEEDAEDVEDAGGSDTESELDEKETEEDRDFIADSESDAGSDQDDDDDDQEEFTGGSDDEEDD